MQVLPSRREFFVVIAVVAFQIHFKALSTCRANDLVVEAISNNRLMRQSIHRFNARLIETTRSTEKPSALKTSESECWREGNKSRHRLFHDRDGRYTDNFTIGSEGRNLGQIRLAPNQFAPVGMRYARSQIQVDAWRLVNIHFKQPRALAGSIPIDESLPFAEGRVVATSAKVDRQSFAELAMSYTETLPFSQETFPVRMEI
jgi:hypothetical protein